MLDAWSEGSRSTDYMQIEEHQECRPNIVYFHVDNLGYGELGCYGGDILRGPISSLNLLGCAATPTVATTTDPGTRSS
jgi:arylsulfatase A-like enzyme